jgi:hypothetical protein
MSNEPKLPDFNQFSRWLAARVNQQGIQGERYDELREAAREARNEFVQALQSSATRRREPAVPSGSLEVLQLLAAADRSDSSPLPEITTLRGFRVTLAYDEESATGAASLCVLVHCPLELIASLEGKTVYLWHGAERFELGQFDGEGKAIGVLPAGIEISASDFAQGRVKLEEPLSPDGE